MFLDRHDPNDDRNMREIRSLNLFSILDCNKKERKERKGRCIQGGGKVINIYVQTYKRVALEYKRIN